MSTAHYAKIVCLADGKRQTRFVKVERETDQLLVGKRVTCDGDIYEHRNGATELIVYCADDIISRTNMILDLHYGTLVPAMRD